MPSAATGEGQSWTSKYLTCFAHHHHHRFPWLSWVGLDWGRMRGWWMSAGRLQSMYRSLFYRFPRMQLWDNHTTCTMQIIHLQVDRSLVPKACHIERSTVVSQLVGDIMGFVRSLSWVNIPAGCCHKALLYSLICLSVYVSNPVLSYMSACKMWVYSHVLEHTQTCHDGHLNTFLHLCLFATPCLPLHQAFSSGFRSFKVWFTRFQCIHMTEYSTGVRLFSFRSETLNSRARYRLSVQTQFHFRLV